LGAGVGTVASPTVVVNPASGAIAGAGLGHGIAKEALELADVRFGGKAPRQGASQVLTPVEMYSKVPPMRPEVVLPVH
jgi:hypothetical protein